MLDPKNWYWVMGSIGWAWVMWTAYHFPTFLARTLMAAGILSSQTDPEKPGISPDVLNRTVDKHLAALKQKPVDDFSFEEWA